MLLDVHLRKLVKFWFLLHMQAVKAQRGCFARKTHTVFWDGNSDFIVMLSLK